MDNRKKLYPCSRCGKVSKDTSTTWRVRYDIWKADPKQLGNQRVLCSNCCIRFQEVFLKELTENNKKTLDNFFSQF